MIARLNRIVHENDGVALILTLLFVVLLTVLVVDFAYEMQVEASLVETRGSEMEAFIAAKSAVAAGLAALSADVLIAEDEAAAFDEPIYDGLDEPWAEGAPLTPLNDAYMQVNIDDEYGKFNLNAVNPDLRDDPQGTALKIALGALFIQRGLEVDPVDAILDWLDADGETRQNGAENEYYSSIETPITPKNGPMDSLEELLLIPGITPEVYFGNPEEDILPLSELLTVHGHPEGRVNVNTAEYEVLVAMLGADGSIALPEETATNLMRQIEEVGPFQRYEDFSSRYLAALPNNIPQTQQIPRTNSPPSQPQEVRLFDVVSSAFRIQGEGQSGQNLVRIEAYVWRATDDPNSAQMFRVLDWRVLR